MSSSASTATHYDAVVLGSGQGGTPLAKAFAGAGQRVALVERAHIGGCCVNEGCTPTKTMVASGRVAYLARRGPDYGVHSGAHAEQTNDVRVAMEKVRQRKRDIVNTFRGGSERGVKIANLDVIMGEAKFTDAKTLAVQLHDGTNQSITADRIFINVGERPATPNIQGFEAAAFHQGTILDSTSVQELEQVPEHLLIVGGGYIGLEFGQLFRRLGAKVTVIQRSDRLMPREDPEIAASLLEILREDGVDVRLQTQPKVLQPGADGVGATLKVASGSKEEELQGSHVLFAAGRTPNSDTLNLDAAGVKADSRGHIVVNAQLETNVPGIWALGDVKGGPAFTHISYDDSRIILANLLPSATGPQIKSIDSRIVPYVMYTDPQLGHVGLHAAEAVKTYKNVQTASMPMNYVARALETDESRGLMKAVVDKDTQQILGFSVLGLEGGELMSIVHLAMQAKVPYTVLQNMPFAHPSLAESLNNVWGSLKDVE